jgi:hypothetical protein
VGKEMAIWRGARADWFHGIAKPQRDSEGHVSELPFWFLRVGRIRVRELRCRSDS